MELFKITLSIIISIILFVDLSDEKLLRPKKKHDLEPNYCGKIVSHKKVGAKNYGYRIRYKTWKITAKDFEPEYSYFHLSCSFFSVGSRKKSQCSNHGLSVRYGKGPKKVTKLCGKMKVNKMFKETKGKIQLRFGKRRKSGNRKGFKCKICHKSNKPEKLFIFVFGGDGKLTSEVIDPETGAYTECGIDAISDTASTLKWTSLVYHENKIVACSEFGTHEDFCWKLESAAWTESASAIDTGYGGNGYIYLREMGKIWLTGGKNSGSPRTDTYLVDPNDYSDENGVSLTEAAIGNCLIGNKDQSLIYLTGGFDGTSASAKVYEYTVATKGLDEITAFTTARAFHACGLYQYQYLVIAGGSTDEASTNGMDSTETFDSNNDMATWSTVGTLEGATSYARIVEIYGELYLLGGVDDMSLSLDGIFNFNGTDWNKLDFNLGEARNALSAMAIPESFLNDPSNCSS